MAGGEVEGFLSVRGAVAPALFFAFGIALPIGFGPGAAVLALLMLLALLLERAKQPGSYLALLLGFGVAGSVLAGQRAAPGVVPRWIHEGQEAVLEGEVEASGPLGARIAVDRAGLSPVLPLERTRFRCQVSGPLEEVLPGQRVRLLARLFASRPPSNPGEVDRVAQDRDLAIDRRGVMRPGELVALSLPPAWARLAQAARRRFVAAAEQSIADGQARALVVALAVGERGGLDAESNEHFNASGLAHILSVSGLHVAVVAFGFAWLLRLVLVRWRALGRRGLGVRLANASAIPALWIYTLLTGAEVPAVRSAIMCTGLVLARALRRDAEGYSALAIAAVIVLADDPAALHDVSFQLSFAAVLGLMVLAEPIHTWVRGGPDAEPLAGAEPTVWQRRLESLRRAVIGGVCTSIAATLATAPLLASIFHRESLVSVGANLVALPVASLLTAAAAVAVVCTPVTLLLRLILPVAGALAQALLAVADAFGSVPFATARVSAPSTLTVILYYLALATVPFLARAARARRLAFASMLALGLLGAWRAGSPRLGRELEVTFLAVGQGDSTFIRFPGGAAWLIDGGGVVGSHLNLGATVLAPFLWDRGVTELEVMALSHPHPDHGLGLIDLAPLVGARELWLAEGIDEGGLIHQLRAALGPTPVRHLAAGAGTTEGGVRVEVLGPPPDRHFDKVNDQSLVLRLTYGRVRVLLPGDAEEEAEEALLHSGADLSATILKAPHHGSRTSSTEAFVKGVHPASVVFCVGPDNRFGFPVESVQERYREEGCRLFRTDRDGAITFRTDGETVSVDRFLAPTLGTP